MDGPGRASALDLKIESCRDFHGVEPLRGAFFYFEITRCGSARFFFLRFVDCGAVSLFQSHTVRCGAVRIIFFKNRMVRCGAVISVE